MISERLIIESSCLKNRIWSGVEIAAERQQKYLTDHLPDFNRIICCIE
jgi:hypothetical protein